MKELACRYCYQKGNNFTFWSNNSFDDKVPHIHRGINKANLAYSHGIIEIHYCPMCGEKINKDFIPMDKFEEEIF